MEVFEGKAGNQEGRKLHFIYPLSCWLDSENQDNTVLEQAYGVPLSDIPLPDPGSMPPETAHLRPRSNCGDIHHHYYPGVLPLHTNTISAPGQVVVVQDNHGGPTLPYPPLALLRPTDPVRSMSATTPPPSTQLSESSYTNTIDNRYRYGSTSRTPTWPISPYTQRTAGSWSHRIQSWWWGMVITGWLLCNLFSSSVLREDRLYVRGYNIPRKLWTMIHLR